MGFAKPSPGSVSTPSPHLFVANCGPALGLELHEIRQTFASFGPVQSVDLADTSGCRVIVSFQEPCHSQAARAALDGIPCATLGNRVLHIQYSTVRPTPKVKEHSHVYTSALDVGIPGLYLFENFVSEDVEQELLAAIDVRPWQTLAKRRVQHYGYEFQYKIRNVDVRQNIGSLPSFTNRVVKELYFLPELVNAKEPALPLDQLTVNEYTPGVGLSPHIDTHSAFEGAIISLSLAGTCVMEFRKYEEPNLEFTDEENHEAKSISRSPVQCKSIFLPERSLLVLLDEARYRWHHYIPHHKIDFVGGRSIRRKQRRVSFTFRKVRHGPCDCTFKSFCDSQNT